jgi:hypothetical protein
VRVGVVLDTTAVLAYARMEGVAVGELIGIVHDDGDLSGVPVLVLLEVSPELSQGERELVQDLIRRENSLVIVLPLTEALIDEVAHLAAAAEQAAAQAIAEARAHDAALATYTTRPYESYLDEDQVLLLE